MESTACRPFVQLTSENNIDSLLHRLQQSLHHFLVEGVIGILLDGGLSRGYGDCLSEIDLLVYLDAPHFQAYQNNRCPFPLGIAMVDGDLYDIKILDFESEQKKTPDTIALWDLSYAKILYDPRMLLEAFLREKLAQPVSPASANGLMWDAWWHYKLAGDIWIHRGDGAQGHFVFNLAMRPLLSSLFVANGEYIPHDKWLIHMSRSLRWLPRDWNTLLTQAFSTGDFSVQSLMDRQRAIDQIWHSINDRLCELQHFDCGLHVTQMDAYRNMLRLTEKDVYTLAEWEEISALGALNYEPLRTVFRLDDSHVLMDRDRLLHLSPADMYSWMYEIAVAVRKVRLPSCE